MRAADVSRAVGEAGGPRRYVHRALVAEHARTERDLVGLMDDVAACGGLAPWATALVAQRLALDTLANAPGIADLSLALDHARALLIAATTDELAVWAQGLGTP